MPAASTATNAPSASGGAASGASAARTWCGPSMTTCNTGPPWALQTQSHRCATRHNAAHHDVVPGGTIQMLCTVAHRAGARCPRSERADDMRNPHAGEPFDTSDDDIAAALLDVSIPTLMLSLVH